MSRQRFASFALVVVALVSAGCGVAKSESDLANEALARGISAHNAGKIDEAIQAYFEDLSHDPKSKYAFFNLGQIYRTAGKPQIAEGYYRQALETDPGLGPALFGLAVIRASAGGLQEAVDLYNRDIQVEPTNAAAYYNVGLVLLALGRTSDGNANIAKAIELDPSLKVPTPQSTPQPVPSATPKK